MNDFFTFVYNHPVAVGIFSILFISWGRAIRNGPRKKEDA